MSYAQLASTFPQVKKIDWVLKFAVSHDTLNKIASASCTAQAVNRRPWQVLTSVHHLRDELIIASAELRELDDAIVDSGDQRAEHIWFVDRDKFKIDSYPTLAGIDFVGRSWQTVKLDPISPWLFRIAIGFCVSWNDQLIAALGKRMLRDAPAWLEACCQCLSGEALFGSRDDINLECCDHMLDRNGLSPNLQCLNSPDEHFGVVADFVRSFKPDLEFSTDLTGLRAQYLELRDRLCEKFLPMPVGDGLPKIDMEAVWCEVHTNSRIYSGCEDCIYIIACCAMKTHCESVVEAQCSVLNSCSPRRHLGHSGLSKEAFLVWNSLGLSSENVDHFLMSSLERMPKTFTGFRRKANDPKAKNKKVTHSTVIDRVLAHQPHGELSGPRDFVRQQLEGRLTRKAAIPNAGIGRTVGKARDGLVESESNEESASSSD
ncbi:hypothetical protein Pmar_PMAR028992 [Perkinsus marinus ATCC 50983]|uniref:Uncharacterized protein n=1 Tax=Perkinsus marinus (strain ATCC 50983 / TXsc) TaxID=423536 RepID=C5L676_PERM5|nr:hypothetical protein Pmar_PMAR028992 [Perkinsus marinus ATCC 50983]EER07703.1 hypothetical protein Pmar_PMAR028992 [Perkinsus marinus ATCC 50983]|eukprot:XP_002775887.1 hypothetical protein Pmar_PMAR028992 [Perkinsus marinus ATCC 50983]